MTAPLGPRGGRGETRGRVLELTKRNLTPREIGAVLGISTQVVHRHLKRLRRDGELDGKGTA